MLRPAASARLDQTGQKNRGPEMACGGLLAKIALLIVTYAAAPAVGFTAQPLLLSRRSDALQCSQTRQARMPALRMKEDGDATKVMRDDFCAPCIFDAASSIVSSADALVLLWIIVQLPVHIISMCKHCTPRTSEHWNYLLTLVLCLRSRSCFNWTFQCWSTL